MIKIEICCGTNCYIMGASDLLSLDLNNDDGITVVGATCLGVCKNMAKRPPYIKINGVVHSEVTQEKMLQLIKEVQDDI